MPGTNRGSCPGASFLLNCNGTPNLSTNEERVWLLSKTTGSPQQYSFLDPTHNVDNTGTHVRTHTRTHLVLVVRGNHIHSAHVVRTNVCIIYVSQYALNANENLATHAANFDRFSSARVLCTYVHYIG